MTLTCDISANVRAEVARARRRAPDVAASIGMSYSTWTRRMTHPGGWRVAELCHIATELGIDPRQLFAQDR